MSKYIKKSGSRKYEKLNLANKTFNHLTGVKNLGKKGKSFVTIGYLYVIVVIKPFYKELLLKMVLLNLAVADI